MRKPKIHPTISSLLARSSEKMSRVEITKMKKHLLNAVSLISEADLYEEAAQLAKIDPHAAHRMMLSQGDDLDFEAVFPTVRVTLMADLVRRMKVVEGVPQPKDLSTEIINEMVDTSSDMMRRTAFKLDPGKWLPDAEQSPVSLMHASGFWMVRVNGVDMPWAYAARSYARSVFVKLYRLVEDGGYGGGILVGPAGAMSEVDMPPGYRFVAVGLGSNEEAIG